jgi:hypothetical protein
MTQPAFKIDQLQLEPGSSGTRLLRRASDGSLELVDPSAVAGITLSNLAGLKTVGNTILVGKSGLGVHHTSIQAALDSVPVNSGPTNPYLILVFPGVYNEDLTIVRDRVVIQGLGNPILSPTVTVPNDAGADHAILIEAGLGSEPLSTVLRGLVLTNPHNNKACVRINGTGDVGLDGIWISDCQLLATASGGNQTISALDANDILVHNCLVSQAAPAQAVIEGTTVLRPTLTDFGSSLVVQGGAKVGGMKMSGSASLTLASTVAVTLPYEAESANYEVRLEPQGNPGSSPWVTGKTATGFTINFAAAVTVVVRWVADGRL